MQKRLFVDPLVAQTYFWKIIGEKKEEIDFSVFLLIFLKGIVRDVICGIAKTVERANEDSGSEKELLWKLAEYKRGQLFALLEKGKVKHPGEPQ